MDVNKYIQYREGVIMKKDLILIGAGGFAKSVIDSIDEKKYKIFGFIDDIKRGIHLGYPILTNNLDSIEKKENYCYFISIGDNKKRKKWFKKLEENRLEIINVIDKTAVISKNVTLEKGIFVGKLAIINSDVRLGDNIVVNTKALLEHGVRVDSHSNISTNTTINGDVQIGQGSFIGSSSVINGQLRIGNNVMIGSGSVVIKDVEDNCVVAGVPAKLIRRKGNEE